MSRKRASAAGAITRPSPRNDGAAGRAAGRSAAWAWTRRASAGAPAERSACGPRAPSRESAGRPARSRGRRRPAARGCRRPVGDEVFVALHDEAARIELGPEAGERVIGAPVGCEPVEAVGVVHHAGLHRVAAAVDDAGAGQHAHHRAGIGPVFGQLVGGDGLGGAPARARPQIGGAEPAPVGVAGLGDPGRERLAAPVRFGVEQLRQIGQLARAFDLRVAGEDLLDQRRPRPRQPDEEDDLAPRPALSSAAARAKRSSSRSSAGIAAGGAAGSSATARCTAP